MKGIHQIIIFTFYTTFMLSIWCIDISFTAINGGMVLTNGFITLNPARAYHIAVGVCIMSVFLLALALLKAAENSEDQEN